MSEANERACGSAPSLGRPFGAPSVHHVPAPERCVLWLCERSERSERSVCSPASAQ